MTTPLNITWLQEHQMPISAAFAAQSLRTGGTVADYIRDHLGYRLELTSAQAVLVQSDTLPRQNGASAVDIGQAREWNLTLRLRLVNRGFSAPVNRRVWGIHLIDQFNGVQSALAEPSVAPDWRLFYPVIPGDPLRATLEHVATLSATVSNVTAARYRLGFSLVDPLAATEHSDAARSETAARHSVRFTNAEWISGVNVVGSIEMSEYLGIDS